MAVFRFLFSAYSLIWFSVLMLLIAPFIFIPVMLGSRKVAFAFIRLWAKSWSFLVGVRFRIHGLEHIDNHKPYIFIFNHRSFLDAPVIPVAIPQEIKALGKKELFNIPFFGWLVSYFAVWVDRKNPTSREQSLEKLGKILRKGTSIVVAPEGTRNDTSIPLLPFYNGAFKLAIETQTPVLPMAIINANNLLPKRTLNLKPGKVHVYFSSPIIPPKTLDETNIEALKQKCHNRLEAMILTHE